MSTTVWHIGRGRRPQRRRPGTTGRYFGSFRKRAVREATTGFCPGKAAPGPIFHLTKQDKSFIFHITPREATWR